MSRSRLTSTAVLGSVGLFVAALVLAGCGGGSGDQSERSTAKDTGGQSVSFNKADTEFVLAAGKHLGTSLSAAQIAVMSADDPAVVGLARDIVSARAGQVDRVAGWLRVWGKQGAEFGHDAESGGQDGAVKGLSEKTLQRLSTLTGARFDRVFLAAMAAHLESGADIWRTEVAQGSDPGAVALARQVGQQDAAFARQARALLTA